jgi:cbb3-type cytochrome oxidase subunit 3
VRIVSFSIVRGILADCRGLVGNGGQKFWHSAEGLGSKVLGLRLALLIFALLLGRPVFPADTKPELEFQPSTVDLAVNAEQPVTVLVVLHNSTNTTLRDLRLSSLPSPNLDVQATTITPLPGLAPSTDYVWKLAIKPTHAVAAGVATPSVTVKPGGGPEAGFFTTMAPSLSQQGSQIDENLGFRLNYVTSQGNRTSSQVIFKSLRVKTQDLGDLEQKLSVQIKTTLESVDSSQWGSIYLVLKNTSARTINLINIAPIGRGVSFCGSKIAYGGLPFCFYSSPHSLILAPHQTAVEEFPVKTNDRLKAGKYLLVFQIALQASDGGTPLMGDMLISQDVDVGVLDQSAILTVAGIPAFFVLPGALLLLTIGLCRSLEEGWWPAPDQEEFPLKCKSANFWLVSVIMSLLIAIVPWLFRKRWYFSRYGLQDVGLVWFACILAGVGGYVIWWIYRNHRRLQTEERKRLLAEASRTRPRA